MRIRTAPFVLAACLLFGPACSSDDPDIDAAPDDSVSGSTAESTPDVADALVGTYSTPPLTVKRMAQAALRAGYDGYDAEDVEDILTGEFADAHSVVFTLELSADRWVAFKTVDDGQPEDMWAGPYEVLDDSTVVAGEAPCGPITYDYRIDGAELVLEMTDNDCVEPDGTVPGGELVAQTILYQSAPFQRIG
ncbi:MAG: hypothetical protein M3237_15825 [Actinomycetota bacterium]|nr:hypothetical protein [Actinomycetota bacterium]